MNAWPRRIVSVFALLLLAGCGRESDIDDEPLTCDPLRAGEIVLGYQALSRPDEIAWEGRVMGNGWEYLFVDGACRYWVLRAADLQYGLEDRHGTLTAAQLESVNRRVFARDWRPAAEEDLPEGPPRRVHLFAWRNRAAVHCASPCVASSCDWPAPICGDDRDSRTAELGRAFGRLVDELYDAGTPTAEADLRVAVRPFERDPSAHGEMQLDDYPFVAWDGSLALATLSSSVDAIAFDEPSYAGFPQVVGPDAVRLREIAALFDPVTGVHRSWPFVPVLDEGVPYQVLLRTALPFEAASGLVRAPEGFEGTWYRPAPDGDEESR